MPYCTRHCAITSTNEPSDQPGDSFDAFEDEDNIPKTADKVSESSDEKVATKEPGPDGCQSKCGEQSCVVGQDSGGGSRGHSRDVGRGRGRGHGRGRGAGRGSCRGPFVCF